MRARLPIPSLLALVLLAACNAVVGFGDLEKVSAGPSDAGKEEEAPARPDGGRVLDGGEESGPPASCDPAKPFGAPKPVDGPVNSSGYERSPTLTADELVIVFDRSVNLNAGTILMAKRSSRTEPFAAPAELPELMQGLAGVQAIGGPSMTSDGLTIFYFGELVSADDADIFSASRTVVTAPFGDARKVARVGSTSVEVYPSVMHGGGELWFTSERLGGVTRHLFRSLRDPVGLYEEATLVSELRSSNNEAGVALSTDGLTVYFGSDRPGGLGGSDVWIARRPTPSAAFGAAEPVNELSSATDDYPAWLSPDGCRIYLTSDRGGSMDILVAERP